MDNSGLLSRMFYRCANVITLMKSRAAFFAVIVLISYLLAKLLSGENSTMAVRHLTLQTGAKMPMIGLGTWNSQKNAATSAVMTAIDVGYRHIDCAHDYENESEVGDGIKAKIVEGKVAREDLFITSKLWPTYFAPGRAKVGLEQSLKRLKLDYLDLYLLHFPFAMKDGESVEDKGDLDSLNDESIDYVDTWKEMVKLQKMGLTRAIGVSNFNQFQIDRLARETSYTPDVHQFECHPYLDQTDLVEFCQSRRIVVTGYSPLGSPGNLAPSEPSLFEESVLQEIAESHKLTIAQVLLRYQIQRNIAVIPKSVTDSRIASNFDIFGFRLTDDEMARIKSLNRNWRTCDVDGWASRTHKYYPFKENYKE